MAVRELLAVGGDTLLLFLMLLSLGGNCTLLVAETRRGVDVNYEEVKEREDKHDNTKLTPLLFMCA